MIAPSEKHLEDWIVANSANVFSVEGEPAAWWDGTTPYINRIVKRQCRLPSGISDLIVVATGLMMKKSVAAVELKKGAIDTNTVAQCLRYIRDLREIFLRTRYPVLDDVNANPLEWTYNEIGICSNLLAQNPEITGLLIGHSIPDDNILIACEASNIVVLTYEYDGNDYVFTRHEDFKSGIDRFDSYQNFSCGAIGDAMREVIKERYEDEQNLKGGNYDR